MVKDEFEEISQEGENKLRKYSENEYKRLNVKKKTLERRKSSYENKTWKTCL